MRNSKKYKGKSRLEQLKILGYAHNQGAGGAAKWLRTGRVGRDAFGTAGTKYYDALGTALANRTLRKPSTSRRYSSGITRNLESSIFREVSIWGNGNLKESNPQSWKHLGRYWDTVGNLPGGSSDLRKAAKFASSGLLTSLYRGWNQRKHNSLARGGQNYHNASISAKEITNFYNYNIKKYDLRQLPYGSLEKYLRDFTGTSIPVPYNSYWSSIFVCYAMRNEPEFVQHAAAGTRPGKMALMSHRAYIDQAKRNYSRLIRTGDASSVSYINIDIGAAKRLGYEPQPGDILVNRNGHGDVLTKRGKVGGNLSDSVKVATSRTSSVVTNSSQLKQALVKGRRQRVSESKNLETLFNIIQEVEIDELV